MGYFSQLGDIWSDWGTQKSFDLLGDAWGQTKESFKSYAAGIYDLTRAPFDDKLTMRDAFIKFQQRDPGKQLFMGAGLSALSGVVEFPVIKQVFGSMLWAQNEWIKRPLGTGYLQMGDWKRGKSDLLDKETWRQAYNDTRYVSTGQAAVYNATGDLKGDNTVFDPRSADGQWNYHNNNFMKYTSGSVDLVTDVFADPTIVGAKLGVAAKLKYLSVPMKTTAQVDKYMSSAKYERLREFIQKAPNPEVVRQRVFNAHRGGDKASALLWSVRHDPDLYNATFDAMYGSMDSWAYLVDNAPRIAQVTGRTWANQTIADAANRAGQSSRADNIVNAVRETDTAAFADAIANGAGAYGAARGTLIGQHRPRLSVTSQWRAGVHNWATFGPQVFRGSPIYPVLSRGRYALPSAKFTRFLDVNDTNSVGAFRSNLERAPFTKPQLEQYVSAYGRASSPEARARVAAQAEDAGFKIMAAKHGYSPAEVEKVLPKINQWRVGNRKVFATSRRYFSNDVRKLAQKYIANGRIAESDNAFFLAEDVDAAVARGFQPRDFFHMLDEDGNNIFVPGRFDVNPSIPATVAQQTDIAAMLDWRVLDTALAWSKKGPLGIKGYTVINAGANLLDTVNAVWKVTALIRPGYVWRMLSDDLMRRSTLYGASRVMMSTSRGIVNSAQNYAGRFGLVRDYVWHGRRRSGLDSVERIEGEALGRGERYTDLQREPLGGPYDPDPRGILMSAAPGTRLREAIERTAGRDTFTKADLKREMRAGTNTVNRVIDQMQGRGLIETVSTRGRVTYRRSNVSADDLRLMYEPLEYSTYDRALADGALSVDDFLRRIELHAERGDLPTEVAQILQSYRDGTLAPKELLDRQYRRDIIDRSLNSVGRGAYTQPAWQQELLNFLAADRRAKPVGQVGQGHVVDPMTGTTPTNVAVSDFTLQNGREAPHHIDSVYDYVADNIDALLMPDNLLHVYVTPAGNVNLSVARYDGKVTTAIKQTGGKRIKALGLEGKPMNMAGHDRVVVNTAQGPIEFEAAFEGAEGSRKMAQASSRGPSEAWADQVANTDFARMMNESHSNADITSDAANYATAWERAVNAQLHGDEVARMFMSGKTEDDVLNWMRNTTEGRAYWGRLGPWQSRPVEQIYTVKAMVDTYLPNHGDEISATLRAQALQGKARFDQYSKLFNSVDDMPAVHGASLDIAVGGVWTNMIKKGVDRTFRVLSDLPADKASRFPFFAERYTDHLRDMAPMWVEQAKISGNFLSAEALTKIQNEARTRALADVKKYLYDTSAAMDMANSARMFVPFASAIGDSFLKWGVIAREKGVIPPMLNIWKIWTAPDRAGLVQDADGNVKRWDPQHGKYVWYQRNPKTGEMDLLEDHKPHQEYIVFQLPASIPLVGSNKTASGAVMPTVINKETFNTFLGLPTAGPLVAYPANEFALKNPEVAENRFFKRFILPFGPSADVTKAVLPSNVRGTYYWLTGDEESKRGVAQAVMQTEYTKYALGMRDKPPTMQEVQDTAEDIAGLQWATQFLGVSSQFKSPYQPYIDYYRMLQQTDPENATARFYAEMGDEFKMMTASVSRNMAGLPASVETFKAQKKYKDLIAKYPDLASLIVGAEGAGEFSSAVYQAQLEQSLQPGSKSKMREVLPLQDSVEDAERRYVWTKYSKMMDAIDADMAQRGLTSLTQKRAKDLKAVRDKFIEQHKYWVNPQGVQDVNPWFSEFSTVDRAAMTKRLTAMAQLVTDDRIGGRDEMRGLYDYLRTRTQVRQEMERYGFATLSSKKSARLAARWDAYVTGLKESNLSFAALHNRWLTNDDMTADIMFDEGV